jgi:D-threo-aldose 1-dehydrogenase
MTRLGLGCAPLGNLYSAIDAETAAATVDAAWAVGIRYFDTAPHYGLGLSERRLGAALRGLPRDAYTISTKVGRLLVPDPAGVGHRDPAGFDVPADHRRVWAFDAEGVRRSLADSLDRLGLGRVDLVLIHDPEDHAEVALREAYPVLHGMRAEGTVGAIGVGSKDWRVLHRFVVECELDAVLLAGRYTLLDQSALDELLPACVRRGVSVVNAGVFNSGILAVDAPHAGLPYEYGPAPSDVVDRAVAIAAVCGRHGTSLPAAALSFAAAHPAVAAVLIGAASPAEVRRNAGLLAAAPPPAALWDELVAEGLMPAAARAFASSPRPPNINFKTSYRMSQPPT